ncbi:KEOPS complex subunit Pcc1 [Halorubrum sp. BV1]|uniref:KEOPS complex subunit Pcc1 n=1 Tax=Halorubrum sp. BV1 TaxID=1498500 RepID=UPI000679D85E|nr:KEOPS complex subunit Pcc1 [Halorubrum sp. BV1]
MTVTGSDSSRTAIVRTTHADAALVAAALAPDDTESMATRVDGDAIACEIERETTGGLQSTVDDYVVNLHVADRIAERARAHRAARGSDTDTADTTNTADTADTTNTADTADTTDTNT